jgi:hypothetical protein
MKIQLPDKCPVCGAGKTDYSYSTLYECGLSIKVMMDKDMIAIHKIGICADKVLIKFGTSDTTGYEEKE